MTQKKRRRKKKVVTEYVETHHIEVEIKGMDKIIALIEKATQDTGNYAMAPPNMPQQKIIEPPKQEEVVPVIETTNYDLCTEHVTLTSSMTYGQTMNLPILYDTTRLDFELALNYEGELTKDFDFCDIINHIQLATSQGLIKAIIPGEFLALNYLRVTKKNLNTIVPKDYVNQHTSLTQVIPIPGLNLPRSFGPWQLTAFYNNTNFKSAKLSNHIIGYYGDAGKKISRYLNQTISLTEGLNHIMMTAVPVNVLMTDLMITNLSASDDILSLTIANNGQLVISGLSGKMLKAKADSIYVGTLPYDSLLIGTTFVLNSSGEFTIRSLKEQKYTEFLWYWLEDATTSKVIESAVKESQPTIKESVEKLKEATTKFKESTDKLKESVKPEETKKETHEIKKKVMWELGKTEIKDEKPKNSAYYGK